jgi:hypothetical protein
MTSIFSLALALAATALAGCASDDPTTGEVVPSSDVHHVLVSSDSIATLDAGEYLPIDLVDNIVYHFDYRSAPIDYTRVMLVNESGAETPMSQSMEAVAAWDYGSNPEVELLNAPNHRFILAMDPADFGLDLSDAQITELKETGYLYTEKAAPSTQPQTTEDGDCIEADCIVCPGGWGTDGSTCYTVHHVWCD